MQVFVPDYQKNFKFHQLRREDANGNPKWVSIYLHGEIQDLAGFDIIGGEKEGQDFDLGEGRSGSFGCKVKCDKGEFDCIAIWWKVDDRTLGLICLLTDFLSIQYAVQSASKLKAYI